MQHSDFHIGLDFYMTARPRRCTDIGTRVMVAIQLNAPDPSWYKGPPYAVVEHVFDRHDLGGCSLDPAIVTDPAPTFGPVRFTPSLAVVLADDGIGPEEDAAGRPMGQDRRGAAG